MDHFLDIIIGGAVAWVLTLEVRFQMEKAKNQKLQEKAVDDDITQKIHLESDDELNAHINERFGRSTPKA